MDKGNDNLATEILHHLATQNKRLFIALITILIMFFVSNLAWIWVFNQYDFASYEYSQDGNGENNLNSNIGGDVYNGAEIKGKNEDEEGPFISKGNGKKEKEEEVNANQ